MNSLLYHGFPMSTSPTADGEPPSQAPNPNSGQTPSPSFANVVRGIDSSPPIRHRTLFEHPEYGQFAVPVFKKQDEQANWEAVTYRVPKSISSSTFIAAVWNSFEFEDFDQDYIISA